jgi:hypothetical protein
LADAAFISPSHNIFSSKERLRLRCVRSLNGEGKKNSQTRRFRRSPNADTHNHVMVFCTAQHKVAFLFFCLLFTHDSGIAQDTLGDEESEELAESFARQKNRLLETLELAGKTRVTLESVHHCYL